MTEEVLAGGGVNQVTRQGETVFRTRTEHSAVVEQVLGELAAQGFTAVPRFLGISPDGRQMLSYLAGEAGTYPLSDAVASEEALLSAARLLRRFHDATTQLDIDKGQAWMLPAHEPAEVLCHGDFAPYNLIFRGRVATAIIDLDTIHPGPRKRDIAYAIYRFAPLVAEDSEVSIGSLATKGARASAFCDAYGLAVADRADLIEMTASRLLELVDFMRTEAAAGNAAFQRHLDEGHGDSYLADVRFLQTNAEQLTASLCTGAAE